MQPRDPDEHVARIKDLSHWRQRISPHDRMLWVDPGNSKRDGEVVEYLTKETQGTDNGMRVVQRMDGDIYVGAPFLTDVSKLYPIVRP